MQHLSTRVLLCVLCVLFVAVEDQAMLFVPIVFQSTPELSTLTGVLRCGEVSISIL